MPDFPVEGHGGVLDVDVIDAVGEFPDEKMRLQALPDEMAGVEIEAEGRPPLEGFRAGGPRCGGRRRSRSDGPRGRTGRRRRRTRRGWASRARGFCGIRLRSSPPSSAGNEYQAFQIGEPMKPLTTPQPRALAARAAAFISSTAQAWILSGLPLTSAGTKASSRSSAGRRRTGRPGARRWPSTSSPYFFRISRRSATYSGSRGGPADIQVVAPAGDLQPVIAPGGRFFADGLERQVGPLAGKQRDRSSHIRLLLKGRDLI